MKYKCYVLSHIDTCDDCFDKRNCWLIPGALQAARQTAEQRAEDLAAQVDRLTEQAVEAAAEAQHGLEAAHLKAAREAEKAEVNKAAPTAFCLASHHILCLSKGCSRCADMVSTTSTRHD